MSWKVTLVHGNDKKQETVVSLFWEALQWVIDRENENHDGKGQEWFEEMKQTWTSESDSNHIQYGTNYHYVNLDRV